MKDSEKEIIKGEEEILDQVLVSIENQLTHSKKMTRDQSRLARELTSSIVAAVTDEDKQLLSSDEAVAHALTKKKISDSKSLDQQLKKPYFARFETEEEINGRTKELEYKLGYAANPDCRIIDWRQAPIAKLFYEYEEGDEFCEEVHSKEREGTITLRRGIDIKDGELVRISSSSGTFVKEDGEWKLNSGPMTARDLASEETDHSQLPQILSLITSTQYDLITGDLDQALLIQGVAGSGKTTVALHRLAWLLHEDNSDIKPEECLVLTKSQIMKEYIAHSLKPFGIGDVPVNSFDEWAETNPGNKYGHIVVDEGQDFTPEEFSKILDSVLSPSHVTIVGDTAQQLDTASTFPGWEALRERWSKDDGGSNFIHLEVSHRSTLEIMKVAEAIRGSGLVTDGRPGAPPIWFRCDSESRGIPTVIAWLKKAAERYPNSHTAVLCKNDQEAREVTSLLTPKLGPVVRHQSGSTPLHGTGVIVSGIKQVKGLEFTNVLLWNPTKKRFPEHDPLTKNLLYVAISRAEENLCIVTWGASPFDKLRRSLLREYRVK